MRIEITRCHKEKFCVVGLNIGICGFGIEFFGFHIHYCTRKLEPGRKKFIVDLNLRS